MRSAFVGHVLLIALITAACGRHDAPTFVDTGNIQENATEPRYSANYASGYIECVVNIRGDLPSTRCGSALSGSSGASAALITQQCTLTCVEPLPPTYNARNGLWIVQFRLRHRSYQPLGTLDGRTPSAWKTSLVMADVPRATIGAGTILVKSPTARISAHPKLPRSMPYLTYPGILFQGQPSDFRSFGLHIPAGIRQFVLRVAIVADVQPLLKITEVMPGVRVGKTSAGAFVELENVGSAAISNTTLLVVDSIPERKTVVIASMRIADDWEPRERRIVASSDLRSVLFTPIYGQFPSQHVFDNRYTHRIRVMSGGRYGKLLDDLWINPATVALGGTAFERAYRDMGGSSTKLYHPAWTPATEIIPTRCAGAATCPILKGTPAKSPI